MSQSDFKPRVTISTIAEKSGFSPSTVSRVLNGRAKEYRISKETVDKILKVNSEYNYQPNPVAVNLRMKKSFTIGLVIPSLNNPFFVDITSFLNSQLRKKGYNILLAESEEDLQTEEEIIKQLYERNIDGIIIIPCDKKNHNNQILDKIYTDGTPIIYIDRYITNSIIPHIVTDNEKGAYEGIKYLIEMGHKKIACIQGLEGSSPCIDRKNGYLKALSDYNLEPSFIGGDEFNIECGIRETENILKKKEKPTAIFAMSSTIALGVMKTLERYEYNIPNDISLLGFDDYIFLDYLATPLTTISQPVDEISKLTVKALVDHLDGKEKLEKFKSIKLDTEIIHRKSIHKPKF